jgi:hypothetical protein
MSYFSTSSFVAATFVGAQMGRGGDTVRGRCRPTVPNFAQAKSLVFRIEFNTSL